MDIILNLLCGIGIAFLIVVIGVLIFEAKARKEVEDAYENDDHWGI